MRGLWRIVPAARHQPRIAADITHFHLLNRSADHFTHIHQRTIGKRHHLRIGIRDRRAQRCHIRGAARGFNRLPLALNLDHHTRA